MKTRRGFPSLPASGPLQAERHRPVWNAGFREFLAMGNKTCTRIEPDCVRLGMQMYDSIAPRASASD